MELKLNDEVALATHKKCKWIVSFIEGNKIYCYRFINSQAIFSIVVDKSLLIPYTE